MMSLQRLSKCMFSITCLAPLKGFHFGSIINWLNKFVKFAVFRKEVPELHGSNLVFLVLSGEILRTCNGNTTSDPLPLASSETMGVSETLMSLQRLSKCMFSITCFCVMLVRKSGERRVNTVKNAHGHHPRFSAKSSF